MSLFLAKRCPTLLATLLFTSLVVFLVLEVLPGDPALVRLGVDAPPEAVAALRERLGLDRPAAERYLAWLAALASGRLGDSYAYGQPVALLLAERLQVTLPLAALSMGLTLATALALGLWAAARHNRPADVFVMGVSQLGLAIPNYVLGTLAIAYIALWFGWIPPAGYYPIMDDPWKNAQQEFIPAHILGASFSAFSGSIYAAKLQAITPDAFEFNVSIMLLCMVVLGGMGSLKGVILGGLLITLFDRVALTQSTNLVRALGHAVGSPALQATDLTLWRWFFFGATLIIVMLLRPEGLFPSSRRAAELHGEDEGDKDDVAASPQGQ